MEEGPSLEEVAGDIKEAALQVVRRPMCRVLAEALEGLCMMTRQYDLVVVPEAQSTRTLTKNLDLVEGQEEPGTSPSAGSWAVGLGEGCSRCYSNADYADWSRTRALRNYRRP
jgi:hypothetical protein